MSFSSLGLFRPRELLRQEAKQTECFIGVVSSTNNDSSFLFIGSRNECLTRADTRPPDSSFTLQAPLIVSYLVFAFKVAISTFV